ncbi:MAG: hypothetical protein ACREU5_06940 [Burkholderiales bacterium]
MSVVGCGCGVRLAHCPTCGRPLERAILPTGITVDCCHCMGVLAHCPACGAFLRSPPDADARRPCWRCRGDGKLRSETGSIDPTRPCRRCGGHGIDPVGKEVSP